MPKEITISQESFKALIAHTLELAHATSTDHVVGGNGSAFDALDAYIKDLDVTHTSEPFTDEQAPVIGLLYELISIADESGEMEEITALNDVDKDRIEDSFSDIVAAYNETVDES